MSLKDLLPEGTFEEISAEAKQHLKNTNQQAHEAATQEGDILWVNCPQCGRRIPYSTNNPFRPFCSERCKLIDLGAWASEEHKVAGEPVDQDEDADLLDDPNLPRR